MLIVRVSENVEQLPYQEIRIKIFFLIIFYKLLIYGNIKQKYGNLYIIRQFTNGLPEESNCVCEGKIKKNIYQK